MVSVPTGAQNRICERATRNKNSTKSQIQNIENPNNFVQDGHLIQSQTAEAAQVLVASPSPGTTLPAFTDSLAIAVIILELLAIFSAHWMASSTSFSTGKILLTRPKTQKGEHEEAALVVCRH